MLCQPPSLLYKVNNSEIKWKFKMFSHTVDFLSVWRFQLQSAAFLKTIILQMNPLIKWNIDILSFSHVGVRKKSPVPVYTSVLLSSLFISMILYVRNFLCVLFSIRKKSLASTCFIFHSSYRKQTNKKLQAQNESIIKRQNYEKPERTVKV